jgi:hypothetical protein
MALIKRIIKPERFNSTELAGRLLRNLGWNAVPEGVRRDYIDAAQSTLNEMVSEGILSCEEPPKDEQ